MGGTCLFALSTEIAAKKLAMAQKTLAKVTTSSWSLISHGMRLPVGFL